MDRSSKADDYGKRLGWVVSALLNKLSIESVMLLSLDRRIREDQLLHSKLTMKVINQPEETTKSFVSLLSKVDSLTCQKNIMLLVMMSNIDNSLKATLVKEFELRHFDKQLTKLELLKKILKAEPKTDLEVCKEQVVLLMLFIQKLVYLTKEESDDKELKKVLERIKRYTTKAEDIVTDTDDKTTNILAVISSLNTVSEIITKLLPKQLVKEERRQSTLAEYS